MIRRESRASDDELVDGVGVGIEVGVGAGVGTKIDSSSSFGGTEEIRVPRRRNAEPEGLENP